MTGYPFTLGSQRSDVVQLYTWIGAWVLFMFACGIAGDFFGASIVTMFVITLLGMMYLLGFCLFTTIGALIQVRQWPIAGLWILSTPLAMLALYGLAMGTELTYRSAIGAFGPSAQELEDEFHSHAADFERLSFLLSIEAPGMLPSPRSWGEVDDIAERLGAYIPRYVRSDGQVRITMHTRTSFERGVEVGYWYDPYAPMSEDVTVTHHDFGRWTSHTRLPRGWRTVRREW